MESDSTAKLNRDYQRVAVLQFAEWFLIGGLVLLGALWYGAAVTGAAIPVWLVAFFVAVVLGPSLAILALILFRGRRARRFVRDLGPRVRECGLVRNTLVAVLDNDLTLTLTGGLLLPTGGRLAWLSAERVYGEDCGVRPASLGRHRDLERRVRGIAAVATPPTFTTEHPGMRELVAMFPHPKGLGPLISFTRKEFATREGVSDRVRVAQLDFLVRRWPDRGTAIADCADRMAELLDAVMRVAWDGPVLLGHGTLRSLERTTDRRTP